MHRGCPGNKELVLGLERWTWAQGSGHGLRKVVLGTGRWSWAQESDPGCREVVLGMGKWFWVWGHGPGLEEMNLRRGNCPCRAQGGGPGQGKGILGQGGVSGHDSGRG